MDNERQPLISVIMACYNAAPFVEEAISSVLQQTIEDTDKVKHLKREMIDTLVDGQLLNEAYRTYWSRDLANAQQLFRAAFAWRAWHTRDLKYLLPALSEDELAEDLAGSRRDLENLLGEKIRYLAYPYGRINDRVINATREAGYEAAFSTQPGFNRRNVDHYRIRRLDIFGTDTPRMLARKIFYGSNDGSWQQTFRYYRGRAAARLGL